MGWTKPSGGSFGTGNVDDDIAVQEEMMGAVYSGVLGREGGDGRSEQCVKLRRRTPSISGVKPIFRGLLHNRCEGSNACLVVFGRSS